MSKQASEPCEQTSERTSEWLSTYIPIFGCSVPPCNGRRGAESWGGGGGVSWRGGGGVAAAAAVNQAQITAAATANAVQSVGVGAEAATSRGRWLQYLQWVLGDGDISDGEWGNGDGKPNGGFDNVGDAQLREISILRMSHRAKNHPASWSSPLDHEA